MKKSTKAPMKSLLSTIKRRGDFLCINIPERWLRISAITAVYADRGGAVDAVIVCVGAERCRFLVWDEASDNEADEVIDQILRLAQ